MMYVSSELTVKTSFSSGSYVVRKRCAAEVCTKARRPAAEARSGRRGDGGPRGDGRWEYESARRRGVVDGCWRRAAEAGLGYVLAIMRGAEGE